MDIITRDNLLLNIFGWWQFAVCLFAFASLMAIWWHLGRKQNDRGQIWLAVSVLCWSLSGMVEVFYSNQMTDLSSIEQYKSEMSGLKSVLSLCNSFFILMALPYFRYLPGRLSSIIESDVWKYIVGAPFALAIMPIIAKYTLGRPYNFINDLDVYYSILTLIFLGAVLWESFAQRKLKLLSYLSLICIVVTFVAQLYKPQDNTLFQLIFSAIFKTCLIMIFFALALSWVKEMVEKQMSSNSFNPDARLMNLKLCRPNVWISGIWKSKIHECKLTPKQYTLLSIFIKAKKDGNGWLKIKPKNETRGIPYPIQHENEITRLLESLLNGIFGKGLWNKEEHLNALRQSIFDREPGKIKLKIPLENIELNDAS